MSSIYVGRQIDQLTQENEILVRQQEQLQDELNHLRESMGEKEKDVVSSIETHITISGGSLTRLEENAVILAIDKQVQQWLEPLKGQEVKLNHLLIPQIVTTGLSRLQDQLPPQREAGDFRPGTGFYLEAKMEKGKPGGRPGTVLNCRSAVCSGGSPEAVPEHFKPFAGTSVQPDFATAMTFSKDTAQVEKMQRTSLLQTLF